MKNVQFGVIVWTVLLACSLINTAVTFIFYQYPSASKCPPVCRTMCRSNPLSSGVRVLWPGKFLVQVQGHVFRSSYQSVSGRWKSWMRDGLHFCSKEAWLTSCIYLLSVGYVVVNSSPRSPPACDRAQWSSSAWGQLQLSSRLPSSPLQGQHFIPS